MQKSLSWTQSTDGDYHAQQSGHQFLIYKPGGGGSTFILQVDGQNKIKGSLRICQAAAEDELQWHEQKNLNGKQKPKEAKNMKRHTKAAPEGMTAPPAESTNTEEVVEEIVEEKLGAQALRRLHQDGSILMVEYDEILGLLENDSVKARLQAKLEELEQELSDIEEEFGKEYGDLPALEGAKDLEAPEEEEPGEVEEVEAEEKDLPGEGDEDAEGDDDVVEAGSDDDDDEVPVEEAVEGMQAKTLQDVRKKYLVKGKKAQDEEDEEDKEDKAK